MMKTHLSILLSFTILIASCRAYNSDPSTLDEAVESNKRVRISQLDGENLKYLKIIEENGDYYGIQKGLKERINQDNIEEVELHNKTKSYIFSGLIVSGITLFFVFSVWFNNALRGENSQY